MRSHVGCGALTDDGLNEYTKWRKWVRDPKFGRKKTGFEIKNVTEGQCQSSPKSIGNLIELSCIFGPNLEILTYRMDNSKWSKSNFKFKVNQPKQNIGDLTQGVLHFWSKFGGSSLNKWQVITRIRPWLMDTEYQIARLMGPTWGPPGSYQPQMALIHVGPMNLAIKDT